MAKDGRLSPMKQKFEVDEVNDQEGSVTVTLRRDMIHPVARCLESRREGERGHQAAQALAQILSAIANYLFHDEQHPVTDDRIGGFANLLVKEDGTEKEFKAA